MSADIIVVNELEKKYPNGTFAVQGLNFNVKKGEIYGILGPNGAGKSTTIGMLGTLVRPSKGKITIGGLDVTKDVINIRKQIGYAMQEVGLDELATGKEFLNLQAGLYGLDKETREKRFKELVELFDLQDAIDKRIKEYSGGMKRKIDLASALIHKPKILFLDEPTEGLDPSARHKMWDFLKKLNKETETTILLTTHYMDEADYLCDKIAIVDKGKIVVEDTPDNLKKLVGNQCLILNFKDDVGEKQLDEATSIIKTAYDAKISTSKLQIIAYLQDSGNATPMILKMLDEINLSPKSLHINMPTLNDVYRKFTGKKLEGEKNS